MTYDYLEDLTRAALKRRQNRNHLPDDFELEVVDGLLLDRRRRTHEVSVDEAADQEQIRIFRAGIRARRTARIPSKLDRLAERAAHLVPGA